MADRYRLLALCALLTACGGQVDSEPVGRAECVYDVVGEDEGDCLANERCAALDGKNLCMPLCDSDADCQAGSRCVLLAFGPDMACEGWRVK